ncbi:putative uroporphyrin-III C-methyltransferase [Actinobacillus minor 202]|uniref:HemX protein n=2 Tax=Actinobacillus TaxID=713 RepID=A0A2U8FJN3_9PAST|nr:MULTISPECIES: uroporphyrinogen-III C-methyltransferase [Actinobacillus]AWI51211.1 HemX protein [Actinobacillus porcitonsillarum]EEV25029.1 putative uroporphyrin-III C-methyltransferase [Actinobacillus minor 202]
MSKKKVIDETVEQAVETSENFAEELAKQEENTTASEPVSKQPEQVIVKKGGTGIALLALLVALGIGGAGYYFGSQKLVEVENQLQQLAQKTSQQAPLEQASFDKEKAQINELATAYEKAQARIAQLEQEQSSYSNQIVGLQSQIQRLGNNAPQVDSSAWVLSDANFLLNNAVRKLVVDTDVETAKSLLLEADSVLSKIANPQITLVRNAIKADLVSLNNVNQVDQNALMQRLTTLANSLDDLPMVDNDAQENQSSENVSDSIDDWQQNIEKTANSFLDKFIRVSDKNKAEEKVFIAPNQEVYLRENIRLRLQIAILAIPRQQNELYKKSLDAVSTWIRSYFDTQNENVKNFLKSLDELSEQTIYIDVPEKLQSVAVLNDILKKEPQKVEKIEIKEEKALVEPAVEAPKVEDVATPTDKPAEAPAAVQQ